MASKVIKFLEEHQSGTPSCFEEEARWRQENEIWLRMSRSVALSIVDYMQENHLSRASRILSGTENLSIKSVAKIEAALGVSCLEPVFT